MYKIEGMVYHREARVLTLKREKLSGPLPEETVQIICAGSSDLPMAEEAAVRAEFMGDKVGRYYMISESRGSTGF